MDGRSERQEGGSSHVGESERAGWGGAGGGVEGGSREDVGKGAKMC